MVICCVTNIKKSESCWIIYRFPRLGKKEKKATVYPINDDNKRFRYAATVVLNHKEIRKNCKKYNKSLS